MTNEEKTKAVVDAVVTLFLETGKDSTVKDIAAKLGWSESKVRAAIAAAPGGIPPELAWDDEFRPSHSRSYRHFQSGNHKVTVYGPTRETLRKMLLAHPKGE